MFRAVIQASGGAVETSSPSTYVQVDAGVGDLFGRAGERVGSRTTRSAGAPGLEPPRASSWWFTYAPPAVYAVSASASAIAVVRVERLARPAGRDPVDRDVDACQRVGAADRPVAAGGHRAPARSRSPKGYCQAPGSPEERQGQLVHLRLVRRPQRLDVRDGAERGEARDVVRVHDLEVREVVPPVGRAVRGTSCLDGVQRLAHRAVAERVEVHLEARGVEPGHVLAQRERVDEAEPGVVGPAAAAVEVGLEHGRGEVLGDAVLHDLDAGRGEPADLPCARRSTSSATCSAPALTVPPQRADHPRPERPVAGGLHVGREDVGQPEDRPDRGVLPGR